MYRIPTGDICMSEGMPFSQHYEARIPVPLSEIEEDPGLALHGAHGSMHPGDQVIVCSFERVGNDWRRLKEVATYRIVAKGKFLEAIRVSKITTVPAAKPIPIGAPLVELDIVTVGNNNFEVRDRAGNVVEQFGDRQQAEEFRKREMDRGVTGIAGLAVKRAFGGKFNVIDSAGDVVVADFPTKAAAEAYIGGKVAA